MAEQLVPVHGGVRAGDAAPRPPTVTYNFVQVHGATPTSHPVFVSPRLTHAQLAQDKPVVYAGTARFREGADGVVEQLLRHLPAGRRLSRPGEAAG